MTVNRHIGAQLRALRQDRGVAPEKLANILSISLERYAAFELGREVISARHLYDLSVFFNVPVTHFYDGLEGARQPSKKSGQNPRETNGDQ